MTSSGEKLTTESFKAKLAAGDYDNRTGALRALGGASMADSDKEKCRTAVLARFGEASSDAGTKGAKKTGKKAGKKASKKATAKPSTPPPPPAPTTPGKGRKKQ